MPRPWVPPPRPAAAVTMILIGSRGRLLGPAARVSQGAARVSAPPRAVPRNLRLTSPCVTTAASVLGAGIMREEPPRWRPAGGADGTGHPRCTEGDGSRTIRPARHGRSGSRCAGDGGVRFGGAMAPGLGRKDARWGRREPRGLTGGGTRRSDRKVTPLADTDRRPWPQSPRPG